MGDLYIQTVGNSKGIIVEYLREEGSFVRVMVNISSDIEIESNKFFPFLILKSNFERYYKKFIPNTLNLKKKKRIKL